MFLVRCLVVGISRRKHHAFDAQLHHFVEEGANAPGIGAIEKSRVGCHAEAALQRFLNALNSQLVAALAADGKIMMFFLAIHVHGEGQVLARLEEVQLFLQEQRVGAQINVFLPRY